MRRVIIVFLLFYSLAIPGLYASGTENQYGKFVPTKIRDDYTIDFVLNSEKFDKIQQVSLIDYGNDGEGDVSIVFYRGGNKEVYFRNRRNYWRYVMRDPSMVDICGNDWSRVIIYHKKFDAWKCYEPNVKEETYMQFMMWRPNLDKGLAEAKKGDWDALAKRISEIVKRIAQK